MELRIRGPGSIEIHFVAASGETLIRRKILVSGSPTVQAVVRVPLVAETDAGEVDLVPVLMPPRATAPEVRFDGQEAAAFTRRRCRDLGVDASLTTPARDAYEAAGDEDALGFDDRMIPTL